MSKTRYVSYLRVSTSKQAASGLGIEAQRAAVAEFIRLTDADQIAEYVEAESGANDERAQLRAAIEHCRSRKASLLVAKLDRLARSVAFVSAVMDSDVPLVAADNPHASRLVLHMLAAVAEFEREQISHRTKAALAAAKARGVKLGTAGKALAARHRAAAVDWADRLRPVFDQAYAEGATTPTRLAVYLNDRAIVSREGGRWHPSNAARLLRRLAPSV